MTFPNTRAALASLAFTHDVSAAVSELTEADEEIANLRAALAQKDATIKGLANALTALKEAAPTTCEVEAVLDDVDAALRLAGVLK
jgi:nitrate reductase assembly molybdenum cofactor insertion protein NarJ